MVYARNLVHLSWIARLCCTYFLSSFTRPIVREVSFCCDKGQILSYFSERMLHFQSSALLV